MPIRMDFGKGTTSSRAVCRRKQDRLKPLRFALTSSTIIFLHVELCHYFVAAARAAFLSAEAARNSCALRYG